MSKRAKKRALRRTPIGIKVLVGKAPPSAHLIYRVEWSDGTTSTERGLSIRTVLGYEHLNGTKAQREKAQENLKPHFFEILTALGTLIAPVEEACFSLDDRVFGKEEW